MAKIYFSKDHEWVMEKDGKYFIGISDYAQSKLGDIVYVELPEVEDELVVGDTFGVVESVKSASDMYAPVSGVVVEINDELEDAPELLNEDAMANWIIAVTLQDESELDDLMDESEYQDFIGEEE